ncbi:MAG: DUF86 domain-containing protein [Candidatus Staskawiczbacteria bacterium]|nr:DUF86 domain-containing protein [Candidatus Staskawiczbacteria bacterium]
MKKGRDYITFLEDIIECSEKIEKYMKGLTLEDFLVDEKTKDAVIVRIQIIGEAVKNLPADLKRDYKGIDWKKSIKLRNIFIHNYFGINCKRLWKTAKVEIPDLKNKVSKILEDLKVNKLI